MSEPQLPSDPGQILLNLIMTLSAPMVLAAGGDIDQARMAAIETVKSYHVRHLGDLITIARINSFGFAAVVSGSQAMQDGIPAPLALRLRGNASFCSHAANENRRTLPPPDAKPAPAADPAPAPMPATAMPLPTFQQPATSMSEAEHRQVLTVFADSAERIAAETAADLDSLPPDKRRSAEMWVSVLTDYAKEARTGTLPAPVHPSDLPALLRSRRP